MAPPLNIKDVRKRSGLSQAVFGVLLGMSDKAVSRLENGRRLPTFQQREAVAMVEYLLNNNLLDEYAAARFGINIRTIRRAVKKGKP